ncbi:L,D-transpeptidase [Afipia sp. P52-10]|uniref:L,D-transpeptidase n=1 Tax=Afipia sp. P52-10 TaxID=1429916 RepID=UPI0004B79677|nr:L,D-transpeptidase [Afipia sp. P52-10]
MNGLRLVSNRNQRDFASTDIPQTTTPSVTRWAARIATMAAVSLFAIPVTAQAQSSWDWDPTESYEARPAPRLAPRPAAKPKRAKAAKAKRKDDPAEVAAKRAPKPQGPLIITVSLERQRMKVYDSNGLFAEAHVSTGTRTHPTPTGVFSIIQKNRDHVSNLYDAPMPYMQRITWSGVAFHTGALPGYAASHGCIRMPNGFAARLWTWTRMGTRVIVAPGEVAPTDFTHPKLITKMITQPALSAQPTTGNTAAAADGPITQRRTADASEAIAGKTKTLSDANAAMLEVTSREAPNKAETKAQAETPAQAPTADAPTDQKTSAETAKTEAPTQAAPVSETNAETAAAAPAAIKNAEAERQESAATVQQPALTEGNKVAEQATNDASAVATTSPVATAPADVKPAPPALVQPVDDIAKPADIARIPEIAKPATAAAPAKPADGAKSAETAAPAVPDAVKPIIVKRRGGLSHVAVFISRKEKKLYVRQGYEPVFDIPVEITDIDRPLGTHVFTARGDKDDASALHWSVVSLPQVGRKAVDTPRTRQGKAAAATTETAVAPALNPAEALDRIAIPADAMEKIATIIGPGGSILISDHGLGWETGRGTDFIVPLN